MKGFLISGTGSGSGKTTITLGLLKALANRGLKVQPFKVGPDYIDTAWHAKVSGTPSHNLDAFMLPANVLNEVFSRHANAADIAVIEGAMGLFDGYGTDPHYCSSAGMSRDIGFPVILVVDGGGASTSVAATVMGFQQFDPELNLAGVIFNKVTTDTHFALVKHAVEKYCGIPVLGRLPRLKGIELPERHLGLLTAEESEKYDPHWDVLAQTVEKYIDLDSLLALCDIPEPESDTSTFYDSLGDAGKGLVMAVAKDAAFNFYYQDNLEMLERSGLELRYFSPLNDESLPECDLVYIGGGYPEEHAPTLSNNQSMLDSLKLAHQQGKPIYAECGGLMYLGQSVEDREGKAYPLVGVLDGYSTMAQRLQRFGYCDATANEDNLIATKGQVLKGHEFHYSEFHSELEPAFSLKKEKDGIVASEWAGGYQVENTFASYLHLHFGQAPQSLVRLLNKARSNKQ